MSQPKRSRFVMAVTAGATIVTIGAQPLFASAKPHVALQIKRGLWEFDTEPRVSGDTVIANAISARIPPSQLPAYLAKTRRMLDEASKQRECINQARFEQQLLSAGAGCKQTSIADTPVRLELVQECRSNAYGAAQSTTSKTSASSANVIISSHSVTTRLGKTMVVNSVQTGHWVGPNCAI